jgi:hypothetical protein
MGNLISSHHTAPLGFPAGAHSHQIFPGGCSLVENVFLPSGYPPGWFHRLYLINIFYLPYISMIFSLFPNGWLQKKYEKYEINDIPCGMSNALDPTKRGIKWMSIQLAVLNSHPEVKQALPAHCVG